MVHHQTKAVKFIAHEVHETLETLACEAALQVRINGQPYTITMRSPGNDENLAIGLLFTEGIISARNEVTGFSEGPDESGDHTMIDVRIKEEALVGKTIHDRSIASTSSCGVCGKIELPDLAAPERPLLINEKLNIAVIPDLLQKMKENQSAFENTGGSHAAAAFSITGELLAIHEDIGRHNAVDKVVGALMLRNLLATASILLVSGRVSYEIVGKCAAASIPFLLAVSAPSSLAVDACRRKGITLIAFCRENRATVYTHTENISQHTVVSQTSH